MPAFFHFRLRNHCGRPCGYTAAAARLAPARQSEPSAGRVPRRPSCTRIASLRWFAPLLPPPRRLHRRPRTKPGFP